MAMAKEIYNTEVLTTAAASFVASNGGQCSLYAMMCYFGEYLTKYKQTTALFDISYILRSYKARFAEVWGRLQERAANADLVVYYYINKEDLNFSELHHLDNYVQGTLAAEPDHVFYLTGSADKGTGTMERNVYLSNARAENVKKILMKDFGVKEENIVIKATVVTDKHLDGALDRCVLIEKN